MASGDQYVRHTVETLPNGETGANALSTINFDIPLQNFALAPDRVTDDRTDEFRGTAEPITPDVTGWNQTTGDANGRLYPNYIGVYLFMLLGPPVTTAGNGVITDPDAVTIPATVTRHVWDSSTLNAAVIRSVETKSSWGNNSTIFFRDRGVTCAGLDLAVGDQNAPSTFSAHMTGLYKSRIADPSITTATDATTIIPFYRGHFSIPTWLAGTDTLIGANLAFTNPVEPDPVLNSSLWPSGWSRPNTAGAVPRLNGTIDTKTIDPDDYDAFLNGTAFTYKQKWISTQNVLATGYKYGLWVEGAASYDNYDMSQMEHKLRHGASIPFTAGKSGATQAYKVTLSNAVASYSSVG